jgi:hypothetical protein
MSNLPVPAENDELPVKGEGFIGELEVMDLSKLKDLTFIVGVSAGDRNKCKILASTIHGPYNFYEMCEEVGKMWKEQNHHAKATILNKNSKKTPKFLDENTIDYIEAHYFDIITEAMLDGVFDEQKEYTCQAGIVEAEDPNAPQIEAPTGDASAAQQNPVS